MPCFSASSRVVVSSSFSGGWTPKRRADSAPIVRGDEPRLFQPPPEHRFERAVERRIAGAVHEVCDHERHRVVRDRRARGLVDVARQRQQRCGHCDRQRQSNHALHRSQLRRCRRAARWLRPAPPSSESASAASGSVQRVSNCSRACGTSGTTDLTGGGGCARRRCNSPTALTAWSERRRPVSMS